MDQGYDTFVMAGPSFYDVMHSEQTAGASFPIAERPLPDGWRRHEQDVIVIWRQAYRPVEEPEARLVAASIAGTSAGLEK